ncbi:MAG: hypothetical protein NTX15_10905 [Candidatus Kapabacteria bacterium]|nr:hypothetical protein [Candidatus Kapabacteria bacterium]
MPVAIAFIICALFVLIPPVYGGDFPEHKRIGDVAMRDVISRDSSVRRFLVDNGFEVLTKAGLDRYVLPTVCVDCASTLDELVGTLIIGKLSGTNGRDTVITYGDLCGLLADTRNDLDQRSVS